MKNAVVRNVLKGAWTRYGMVRMIEMDEHPLAFEFDHDRHREHILDLGPWSVNGQCLNLRKCGVDRSLEELKFNMLQIWIQVNGLNLDMYYSKNAHMIGNEVGNCVRVESEHTMKQRSFLRMQVEINIEEPIKEGIWWTNHAGLEKWTPIKYERLPDFCYGCGRIGHTGQHYNEEIAFSEHKQGMPSYRPWMLGIRPRTTAKAYQVGGGSKQPTITRDPSRETWRYVMEGKREGDIWSSSNSGKEVNDHHVQTPGYSRTTEDVHQVETCASHHAA